MMMLPLLIACATEEPTRAAPAAAAAPASAAHSGPSPLDAALAAQEGYVYNPIGKTDPFRSFLGGVIEPPPVRGREDGVTGDGHHRADLALTLGEDLLGHRRRRVFSSALREASNARATSIEMAPLPEPPGDADHINGRPREHRPARPIEVPRDNIERIEEPLRDAPKLLC